MATYTVQKGDSLSKIAQRLAGVTGSALYGYIQALTSINNIADPNRIFPGQVLTYPDEWVTMKTRTPITVDAEPIRVGPKTPILVPPVVQPKPWYQNPVLMGAAAIALLLYLQRR